MVCTLEYTLSKAVIDSTNYFAILNYLLDECAVKGCGHYAIIYNSI